MKHFSPYQCHHYYNSYKLVRSNPNFLMNSEIKFWLKLTWASCCFWHKSWSLFLSSSLAFLFEIVYCSYRSFQNSSNRDSKSEEKYYTLQCALKTIYEYEYGIKNNRQINKNLCDYKVVEARQLILSCDVVVLMSRFMSHVYCISGISI